MVNGGKEDKLTKALTTFDIVCLGINGMIGTGIFILPGIIAALTGYLGSVVFVICGIFCFTIALCFAEMGSIYDKTGGAYVYATEALGPLPGFMVGWDIWMASLISWAAVANGLLRSLDYFYKDVSNNPAGKIIIVAVIMLLSYLNYRGVKHGAFASNVLSVMKIFPLMAFILMGLPHVSLGHLKAQALPPVKKIGLGFLKALFVFSGFEEMPVPAAEVKEPQKTIPKAILIVLSGVTLFYFLIQFVAQAGYPGVAATGSKSPLAEAAKRFIGPVGGTLLALGAVISIAGINSGFAITTPRSLFALSRDGFLPPFFSKLHPVFATPHVSIAINCAIVLALTVTGTFEQLVNMSALASILQYIPTCLAVIVLRRTRPDLERKFKIPGGYVIPAIGFILCIILFLQAKQEEVMGTLILLAVSLPIYFLSKKWRD